MRERGGAWREEEPDRCPNFRGSPHDSRRPATPLLRTMWAEASARYRVVALYRYLRHPLVGPSANVRGSSQDRANSILELDDDDDDLGIAFSLLL